MLWISIVVDINILHIQIGKNVRDWEMILVSVSKRHKKANAEGEIFFIDFKKQLELST